MFLNLRHIAAVASLAVLGACAVNPVTGKSELVGMSEKSEIRIGNENYGPMQQAEGGEYDILYPAADILPRVKRIHGEYHDVRADDPRTRIDNFAQFLRDNGYRDLVVEAHPKMPNHGMFFAVR